LLTNGLHFGCIFSKAYRCAITGLRLRTHPRPSLRARHGGDQIGLAERCAFQWFLRSSRMR
jgi:hypothetical protein